MSQATITDMIEKTLEKYFQDNFNPTPGTTVPVEYPNMELDQKSLSTWARFSIIWTDMGRKVITGSKNSGQKQIGQIAVQVFTARGAGPGLNRRICDHIMNLFNEEKIQIAGEGKIIFEVPKPAGVSNKNWYQRNVYAPFEHRTIA